MENYFKSCLPNKCQIKKLKTEKCKLELLKAEVCAGKMK